MRGPAWPRTRRGEPHLLRAARLRRTLGPRDRRHHVGRQLDALQLARPYPGTAVASRRGPPGRELASPQRRVLLRGEDAARGTAPPAHAALVQVAGVHDVDQRRGAAGGRVLRRWTRRAW